MSKDMLFGAILNCNINIVVQTSGAGERLEKQIRKIFFNINQGMLISPKDHYKIQSFVFDPADALKKIS